MLPRDKKEISELRRGLMFMSQISINIIVCIAIGVGIGWLLDRWLGTTPWFLLVFSFLGMGAAFKSIFDLASRK